MFYSNVSSYIYGEKINNKVWPINEKFIVMCTMRLLLQKYVCDFYLELQK